MFTNQILYFNYAYVLILIRKLQILENYFVYKNNSDLLALRAFKTLNGQQFHTISNELVDFAIDAYGYQGITPARKRMIATAALSLFPGLKFKSSDGNGTVNFKSNDTIHNTIE